MTSKPRVLVVDDEQSPRESLRIILKDRYDVRTEASGEEALATLQREGPFDAVLLDVKMPGLNGIEVLAKIRENWPHVPVVLVTALTDARAAVQAMKMGAADYLNKPFDVNEIRLVVQRMIEERQRDRHGGVVPPAAGATAGFDAIVGSSAAMQQVYALIRRLLDNDTTVLVLGETGTGKELVARALHFNSRRKAGPFVPVHCAAIPGELLESELFGHERGAFTGATQRRTGMFEAANGGTLFLDEVGEMSPGTQTKLLRAIQEREIRRVGSQDTIHVDVRLVCSTNRDLADEVKKGRFREDLFYRINVVPLVLPPLRDRREDVPVLARHFAEKYAASLNRLPPQVSPQAMRLLMDYSWPGNVRELEHVVERLLVTSDASLIEPGHLPFVIASSVAGPNGMLAIPAPEPAAAVAEQGGSSGGEGQLDLAKITGDIERRAIEEALRRAGGVISEAARALNVTRRILRYKMDKLGIAAKHADDDPEDREAGDESGKAR
ncbi:MAG: sigma-54-dependent Fis family transcriptional regulator [Verrucomicrobia bacterium]|nr:sigma-54-dependent Fis family transcriptional regulator [Verrucomicrobiota bacterium]